MSVRDVALKLTNTIFHTANSNKENKQCSGDSNGQGRTVLYRAAYISNQVASRVAKMSNRKEEVVKTLLLEATLHNDWNMLKTILKNCWNKKRLFEDHYNESRDTLLHITCRENFLESTKVLIENGISPDSRNVDGDTCLHISASNGNGVILHLLFEAGANAITKNNEDKQPVDMTDNLKIKELLRQYSLKSAELQLMKKFNTLKEIIAEEERKEQLDLLNGRYFDDYPCDKLPGDTSLERIDSGICSDLDSNERLSFEGSEQSLDNHGENMTLVKERVKSLHISSSPRAHVERRTCRSGCAGSWTSTSLLHPMGEDSNSESTKRLTKTHSDETNNSGSSRRRKASDNLTRRRKRLSLPDFRIQGSTESYV